MADRASTKTTSLINSLPEFTLDQYESISPAELVVFAVHALQDNGYYAVTEEIVSACFRLFPHRFSLKNYFYWPDSALIMSHLIEAKENGDLKGKPVDGFAVKVQGRQTVKRVAKVLGVTLPAPEKKEKKPAPVPAIKKVEASKPAKQKTKKKVAVTQVKKKAAVSKVTKPVKLVAKQTPVKKQAVTPVKRSPTKKAKSSKRTQQAKPAKAKIVPKSTSAKQEPLLKLKIQVKKKEHAKPIASVKKSPAPKKVKPQKQVPFKSAQPAQLTMALPIAQEKKTKPAAPVIRKAKPKSVKMEMVIVPAPAAKVSKEERAKAGKVVRVMETSDAYRQYKRNGNKSKISEFDFRSLLLCTMESSPETLARNVRSFKGYANIQNRQDLVTFLNFVENSFSTLLNSSGRKLATKR